jgi:hypothetical protein
MVFEGRSWIWYLKGFEIDIYHERTHRYMVLTMTMTMTMTNDHDHDYDYDYDYDCL